MGHSTSSGRAGGNQTVRERAESRERDLADFGFQESPFQTRQQLERQIERAESREAEQRTRTQERVKSPGQLSAEITQLNQYPGGTQIEIQDENGNWATFTAHDPAYMGRNGRYLRRRRYSIVTSNPDRRGVPLLTRSTMSPEEVAEKPWRLKR